MIERLCALHPLQLTSPTDKELLNQRELPDSPCLSAMKVFMGPASTLWFVWCISTYAHYKYVRRKKSTLCSRSSKVIGLMAWMADFNSLPTHSTMDVWCLKYMSSANLSKPMCNWFCWMQCWKRCQFRTFNHPWSVHCRAVVHRRRSENTSSMQGCEWSKLGSNNSSMNITCRLCLIKR